MESAALNPDLLSFVPQIVRRQVVGQLALPEEPFETELHAAVMFADISGFTQLAEKMSRQSEGGAERIGEVLTDCFGRLIELVANFGGEVFKIAGDATLALWAADSQADLELQVLRAVTCGLEIQSSLDGMDVGQNVRIQLRLSVAAGEIRVLHVGGVHDRWESVIAGGPLEQIDSLQSAAIPGEVLLSSYAAELISTSCEVTRRSKDIFVAEKLHNDKVPKQVSVPEPAAAAEAVVRAYIPRSVQARIDAGQTAWLAEFRRITVIFVSLKGLNYDAGNALVQLHHAVRCVQETVYKYEGSINQLIVEDKGTTLIAAWGLSLHSHDDDPVRALHAARHIQADIESLGSDVAIGVTTGQVFTGIRGNARRREFGLIGNVVILAARLMMAAKNSIICDEETRNSSRRHFVFKSFSPRDFKGMSKKIATYSPLSEQSTGRTALIGRDKERTALRSSLVGLEKQRQSSVHLLVGDAGIGKSRLIEDLLEQTQSSTVRSLVGTGDSYERSTSYHPWRAIFRSLYGSDEQTPADLARQAILDVLAGDDEALAKAPLINDLMPLDLPENDLTRNMTTKGRAEGTREVLIDLLSHAAKQAPTMIIIEDGHWIDSMSWALAEEVAKRVKPLLLVITTRPIARGDMHDSHQHILNLDQTHHWKIPPLSDDESLALACHRLEADSLPEEVAEFVQRKAEGNPFFTEQFVLGLRDRGLIEVRQGDCRISEGVTGLRSFRFPDDVQGVITSRIDQVPPSQQLTLKVASVLGREFDVSLLGAVHPIQTTAQDLSEQLENMIQLGLLSGEYAESGVYRFHHSITQDVAYELLPFAQRRLLHHSVAERIEATPSSDVSQDFALLAHHYSEARAVDKAMEYLDKAGNRSLSVYANQEAIRFFSRALAVVAADSGSDAPSVPGIRCATWHRKLGDAHFKLGNMTNAIGHLRSALRILGHAVPDSPTSRILKLLKQVSSQLFHLAFSGRSSKMDEQTRNNLLEASRAASLLAWCHIVRQDAFVLIFASLLSVNLGERAGRRSVMSMGLLGYATTAMRLRKLARHYFEQAREKGVEQNDLAELTMLAVFDALNLIGNGKFEECQQVLDDALQIALRIGDRLAAARIYATKATVYEIFGSYAMVKKQNKAAFKILGGDPSGDSAYMFLSNFSADIMLSDVADNAELRQYYVPKVEENIQSGDLLPLSCLHGILALSFSRSGQMDRALEAADEAIACLGGDVSSSPPVAAPPYRYPVEVYLEFWERNKDAGHPELGRIKSSARKSLLLLRRFAKIYPVHLSRLYLYRGRMAWLEGKRDRARKDWHIALEIAANKSMQHDEGLALLELARTSPENSRDREEYLARATEQFSTLALRHELSAIESLRDHSTN